ncbi:hypothetical protein SUGI_0985660 [Cryptomeria japonica]|uniref:ABC transporter G family member STR-like n=1 Tax=Cryptomeria japonica TaxID=3369 RepID=UPI0024148AF0|nr:ABC transporter G family member STR-like [Cryptomeria japonica]GLJ46744.1 hypothetical protein SUGI_0985660 [Cryptomeria japonica]
MGRLQALLEMDENVMAKTEHHHHPIPPASASSFPDNKPEPRWNGQGLEFQDLSYTVTKKIKKDGTNISREVDLLHEITGQALRGQVSAVMGPSGAGKSTFLDALAGRIASGSLRGSVSVDGRPVSTSYMKMISAYVMQDDQLFPMLTVYETFLFAAEIRLPPSVSSAEKRERVEELVDELGLKSAMHTYIGDEGRRGVSGGERRRVSIGVDIIHKPSLLFLDEPTSGLDSTSAFSVVEKVKDIAKKGSIVIMTIHQPSFRIQMLLDRLIILSRGHLLYMGGPNNVQEYLSGFGREVPEGENTIEYMLDVIKEYEGSTVGLDPLLAYQRDGTKPSEAAKTPQPRTPARRSTRASHAKNTMQGGLKTTQPKVPEQGGPKITQQKVPERGGAKTSQPKVPPKLIIPDDSEEDSDHSLERKSYLHSGRPPRLASDFYKGFSNAVWRTPGHAPNWSTPGRTPGRTPGVTPRRTPRTTSKRSTTTPGRSTTTPRRSATPGRSAMWSATSWRTPTQTPNQTPFSSYMLKTPQESPISKQHPTAVPVFSVQKQPQDEFISMSDLGEDDDDYYDDGDDYYDDDDGLDHGSKFANPWVREVAVLSWRNLLNVIRTPELFLSREIVLTVMALVLATLFQNLNPEKFNPENLNQKNGIKNVNHILSFYIFAVCLLFFSSNDAVPTFIQERFIFIRETSHNAYRASSYVISSFLVYLPFFAVQAVTFAALTYKVWLNLQGNFFYYWMTLFVSLVSTNAYVMLVSATVPSYITGYAVVIATTAIFFLNCGFFLKKSAIPGYWIWIHYISAIKYPFEALLLNQFNGDKCYNYGPPVPQPGPLGQIKHKIPLPQNMTDKTCGLFGDDVLYTMDIGQKNFWIDILILFAWGVLYRFMFYLVLRFWSRNERK